ncbi:MAG: hypothetical protein ACRDAM_09755, partial [Casimicrobium sp.]
MKLCTTLSSAAFALLALIASVTAAPGDLDATFGTGGTVFTPTPYQASTDKVVLQPDGKVIIVGSCMTPTTTGSTLQACMMRYLPDGTLDSPFDLDGVRVESYGSSASFGIGAVVQRDGKIVMGAHCQDNTTPTARFCLSRHQSNGALDPTFGSFGRVVTGIGNQRDTPSSIAIDTKQRILVAGVCNVFVILGFADVKCVVRYLPTGELDPSFGTGGVGYALHANGSAPTAPALAVSGEDKIILAAMCKPSTAVPPQPCVTRLLETGAFDTSFSGDGKVITTLGSRDSDDVDRLIRAVVVQPDQKIVIAGQCVSDADTGNTTRACFLRYREDGAIDTLFGVNGVIALVPSVASGYEFVSDIALQPDGKLVATGECGANAFCVWRIKSDGTFDYSFGTDGIALVTPTANTNYGTGVALQPNGKIVLSGFCRGGDNVLKF